MSGSRRHAAVRMATGIVLLLTLLYGVDLAGRVLQPVPMDPQLEGPGPHTVLVELVDGSTSFHLQELQRAGSLGPRVDDDTVTLVRADEGTIDWLRSRFWVAGLRAE